MAQRVISCVAPGMISLGIMAVMQQAARSVWMAGQEMSARRVCPGNCGWHGKRKEEGHVGWAEYPKRESCRSFYPSNH